MRGLEQSYCLTCPYSSIIIRKYGAVDVKLLTSALEGSMSPRE